MTEEQSWAFWGEDEEAARLPMQLSPPEHAAGHRWEAGRSPAVTQAGSAAAPRGCQGGALAELGDPGFSPMGHPPRAAGSGAHTHTRIERPPLALSYHARPQRDSGCTSCELRVSWEEREGERRQEGRARQQQNPHGMPAQQDIALVSDLNEHS